VASTARVVSLRQLNGVDMAHGPGSTRASHDSRRRVIAALTAAAAISLAAAACSSSGSPGATSSGATSSGATSSGATSSGTGSSTGTGSAAPSTRQFTDAAHRTVSIPAEAAHLGLPFPYNTSDAILLGACRRIATTTSYSLAQAWVLKFCPSIKGKAAPYQTPGSWNVEQVLTSQVDLQFAPSGDAPDLSKLTKAGVPVLVLPDFATLQGLSAAVGFEGRALGGTAPARAAAYQKYLASKLTMITSVTKKIPRSQRPSVLAVDSDPGGAIHVLGAGTIMDQWIGIAGGVNAAHSIKGAAPVEVSAEQIQRWDPDVIVAGLPADAKAMRADPRLKNVKAVIDHKVLVNPAGTIIWMYYGTEEALNIQWAAKELQPKLFRKLDIGAVTTAFYQQFFGYKLTPAQLATILEPTS
jgi:iron complex transport system substrate-binding protein